MDRKIIKGNAEIAPAIMFFAGCFVFFYFFYDHHIYFSEQLQIFRMTSDYFLTYFSKPAFLSVYIGDFITQFYCLRGGGAAAITLVLVILWLLVKKLLTRFNAYHPGLLVAMLPVIFSWIALCDIESSLSIIIAAIINVIFSIICISVENGRIRFLTGIIVLPLLYYATGSYFFLFTILIIIFEFSRIECPKGFIKPILILVLSLLLPFCFKGFFLITTDQAYTWLSDNIRNPRIVHYLPLISFPLAVTVTGILFRKLPARINSAVSQSIQSIVIVVLLLSGFRLFADFELEKILNLDYEAYHGRWNNVINLSEKYRMRNNISSYYTNMALGKLGLMPEKLMEYYQPATTGLFIPVNADENYLTITFSNEIYWQLGDVNASQHSVLLGMIFSPRSQSVRLMKRLVDINIVNGEYEVAEKYIGILEKTMFYSQWARNRRKFLHNEEECNRSEWIASKRRIIPDKDLLTRGDEYKKTLEMLVEAHQDNRMAVDYLLCYDLLDKNLSSFIVNLGKYFKPEGKRTLPKVYEEAVLIEIASGRHTPVDFSNYIFNPESIRRIADYTTIYENSKGHGEGLQKEYGETYWFYYHFATLNRSPKP